MKNYFQSNIRPIALSIFAPVAGFFLVFMLEIALKIEITRLLSSIVNLAIGALFAFLIFPKRIGIPFGKIDTRQWMRRLGFYFPVHAWKHILLGFVLAVCTLSGMLMASIFTGKYTFDWSAVTLTQLVFSLNPALWEELFYRGVIMILLIRITGSVQRAAFIQIMIFGLVHIKGFNFWSLVDAFSVCVLALGFTFAAHKTKALIAGIVFHYLHDALLFLVQLPSGVEIGIAQQVTFYAILWAMVALGCILTQLAADKFNVRAATNLYNFQQGVIS